MSTESQRPGLVEMSRRELQALATNVFELTDPKRPEAASEVDSCIEANYLQRMVRRLRAAAEVLDNVLIEADQYHFAKLARDDGEADPDLSNSKPLGGPPLTYVEKALAAKFQTEESSSQ